MTKKKKKLLLTKVSINLCSFKQSMKCFSIFSFTLASHIALWSRTCIFFFQTPPIITFFGFFSQFSIPTQLPERNISQLSMSRTRVCVWGRVEYGASHGRTRTTSHILSFVKKKRSRENSHKSAKFGHNLWCILGAPVLERKKKWL